MQRVFQQSYHIPGTLAADISLRLNLPFDAQLVHVSAVGSAAAQAGLNFGLSTDTDSIMVKKSVGASGTPVEFTRADFVSGQNAHIRKGDIFVAEVDFNYNNGGGAVADADVTLVFTFTEG